MPNIQIQKEYVAHVSFEEFCQGIDDSPYEMACNNVSVSFWSEYSLYSQTFTVKADSPDELDEKVLELIAHVEELAKNIVVSMDGDDAKISGYEYENFERASKTHYECVTCYGGGYKHANEFAFDQLPANYITTKDEDTEQELFVFYNNYDNIFSNMSEDDKTIYLEDYPLNKGVDKYNLPEKAYGDVIVLTRYFAEKIVKL